MIKRPRRVLDIRRTNLPFTSEETERIAAKIKLKTQDEALAQSLQFSPTLISSVKRLLASGGTIVTDTEILANTIQTDLLNDTAVTVKCYIDDPEVILRAVSRKTTRAEVALDTALAEPGMKLLIIGTVCWRTGSASPLPT